jgi:hypothetical protein
MGFSKWFPATAWVWRKIRGRGFRRGVIAFALVVGAIAIAFRVETIIFQVRVDRTLASLKTVGVRQTTRKELLARIPSLRKGESTSSKCGPAGELYELTWENTPNSNFGQKLIRVFYEVTPLYKLVYWLGYRPRRFYVGVDVEHGVVSRLGYILWISPPENRYPGLMNVAVSSPISAQRYSGSAIAEEQEPTFSVRRYFKWPDWDLRVSYSPSAPDRLKDIGFDLHLSCNWSIRGCRNAADLLPKAEAERQRIAHDALARVQGNDPCPLQIIPAKVRDANGIFLLRVRTATTRARSFLGEPPESGVVVDYDLVEKLQLLEPKWSAIRLKDDWQPLSGDYDYYYRGAPIPNAAITLLKPGRTVIVFDGRGADGYSPCNTVEGSPEALALVRETLQRKDWDYT